MQIELYTLNRIVSESGFKINGASTEMYLADNLSKEFSNSEQFWKLFIVPWTVRIDPSTNDKDDITAVRPGVSQDLRNIGSYHYSIFLNLNNAHSTLLNKPYSAFELFYFYLGLTCDLVEEFLQKIYFLILECTSQKSKILQQLTKNEFLKLAEKWYEKHYAELYDHYYSKGKGNPVRIPTRKYVLEEYFGEFEPWKAYKKLSTDIRVYRNVITHHHKLAYLQDSTGTLYIPKSDCLHKYKKWVDIENISKSSTSMPSNFIKIETQIANDFSQLKKVLQLLWNKPISDLNKLFYLERNQILLAKYDLTFV